MQPALTVCLDVTQVGEVVDGRYEVFACVGKGVFSTVLRARDLLSPRDLAGNHAEVAIKVRQVLLCEVSVLVNQIGFSTISPMKLAQVIRSNDTMYAAGKTEVAILRKLAASDADQRYHCVRMLTSFEYRQHLCIVMEPLVSDAGFEEKHDLRQGAFFGLIDPIILLLHAGPEPARANEEVRAESGLEHEGRARVRQAHAAVAVPPEELRGAARGAYARLQGTHNGFPF